MKSEEGKNFKVDSLVNKSLRFMEQKGAEIVELTKIVDGSPFTHSSLVLAYEFKDGINKYLKKLVRKTALI